MSIAANRDVHAAPNQAPEITGGDSRAALQREVSALQEENARLRNMQRTLLESNGRYQALFDISPDLVVVLDAATHVCYTNPAAQRALSGRGGPIVGEELAMLFAPPYGARMTENVRRVLETGEILAVEAYVPFPTGLVYLDTRLAPIPSADGHPPLVLVVSRDLTARKRAEVQLEHERSRAQSYLDLADDLFVGLDNAGRITLVNRKTCELLEIEEAELVGRDWFESSVPPHMRQRMRGLHAALVSGSEDLLGSTEGEIRSQSGEVHLVQWRYRLLRDDCGAVSGVLCSGRDVSELRRTERQLLQAQRIKAIGELSGGVAHDFNNHITIIQSYCELLAERKDMPAFAARCVTAMAVAAQEAGGLTRKLLSLARSQDIEPTRLDLNDVIGRLRPIVTRLLGENIRIEWRLSEQPACVRGEQAQLEQICMNLLLNARDAMPTGGQLVVTTSARAVRATQRAFVKDIPPGDYVCLSVADSGVGMDSQTLARIFEPFFTTKEASQGSGLGLPIVFRALERHGGYVDVTSEQGAGSTFDVYLPRLSGLKSVDQEGALPTPGIDPTGRGGETILLVEDEESVRAMVTEILELQGYRVRAARSAEDAIATAEAARGDFHLLLTDVVLPEMTGPALAEALAKRYGELPVIFMSGYARPELGERIAEASNSSLIRKPFGGRELARLVRTRLDHWKVEE
ncbi:MAG: PAS domain-containing protein [Candidatus Schekmanbacteria bacterium]|nr:PAS domain-containing protein [Candidatus Schekmanbacteria bacterium]